MILIEALPPKFEKPPERWEMPNGWGGVVDDPKKWCERMPGFCSIEDSNGKKQLVLADINRKADEPGWVVDVAGVCREVLTKVGKKGAFEEYFVYCLDSVNKGLSENANRSTDLGSFDINVDNVDLVINTPNGEIRYPIGGEELVKIVQKYGKIVVLTENDLTKKPDPNSEIIILGLVGTACVLGVLGIGKLGHEVSKSVKRHDEEFVRKVDENYYRAKKAAIDEEAESIAKFLRGLDQKIVDITQETAGVDVVLVNKADIWRRDKIIERDKRSIAQLEKERAQAIEMLNKRTQIIEDQESRRAEKHVDRV